MTVIVKYHHNQTALLPDDMAFQCAVAQIIHTHPIGGHWKFLWERGVLKANILEAKYEAKLEFPWGGGGGWGRMQNKTPSVGGVWIFSGTPQCNNVKEL